jgi:cytochrome bd-type quinol oxidase subunit 2
MLLFALLVSVALACVTRRTTRERIRYAAWSFAMFALVSVGIAWLMYPFSH